MADVRWTPQQATKTGITPSYASSLSTSNTYRFRNDGRVFVHFKKSGAGVCAVTVQTPAQVQGLDIAEGAISVPATTGDIMAGPFAPGVFNDGLGDVVMTFSEITGLTAAVVRV